jgi:hypothetical protein
MVTASIQENNPYDTVVTITGIKPKKTLCPQKPFYEIYFNVNGTDIESRDNTVTYLDRDDISPETLADRISQDILEATRDIIVNATRGNTP